MFKFKFQDDFRLSTDEADDPVSKREYIIDIVDAIVLTFFLVEQILKSAAFGRAYALDLRKLIDGVIIVVALLWSARGLGLLSQRYEEYQPAPRAQVEYYLELLRMVIWAANKRLDTSKFKFKFSRARNLEIIGLVLGCIEAKFCK